MHSGLPCFLPRARSWRRFLVGIENTQSAASPACLEIGGGYFLASILFRLPVLELIGESEEGTEQSGAVVVKQLDQSGLLHEAAEFDELAGAFAAFLHPVAGVVTSAGEGDPIPLHGQVPEPRRGGLQVL